MLLYLAGACELESAMAARVRQLEAGLPGSVEALVQLATLSEGVQRRRLTGLSTEPAQADPEAANAWNRGRLNMADPQTLHEFLLWGLSESQGDHVLLVLAGHGTGLFGALTDYAHGAPQIMGIPGTVEALSRAQRETGVQIDILLSDTCFMNLVEGVFEMAVASPPATSLLVVPVDSAPAAGLPYDLVARILEASAPGDDACASVEEKAGQLVERLHEWLTGQAISSGMACLRLEEDLFRQIHVVSSRLAEHLLASDEQGPASDPFQLLQLHRLLVSAPPRGQGDERGAAEAQELRTALARTVVRAPGLGTDSAHRAYSLYLPSPGRVTSEGTAEYRRLAFAQGNRLADIVAPVAHTEVVAKKEHNRDGLPTPTIIPSQLLAPSSLSGPFGEM